MGLSLLAGGVVVGCAQSRDTGGRDLGPGGASADASGGDASDVGTGGGADDPGEDEGMADGSGGHSDGGESDDSGVRFDVSDAPESCEVDGNCEACEAPEHTPCDSGAGDLGRAIGLGCPGEHPITVSVRGHSQAMGTLTRFGDSDAWLPTEGERYAVIGTGFIGDLHDRTTQNPCRDDHDNLDRELGPHDVGHALPPPLVPKDVGPMTCAEDPTLVGTGDCSNTLEEEVYYEENSKGAFDYVEIRFTTTVPDYASSFSFDVAFFTLEYPTYIGTGFNDVFMGWLESEQWTGNVSFDEAGEPISLNAGFLDDKDTMGGILAIDNCQYPCPSNDNPGRRDPICDADPTVCDAPELDNTCMDGHAATKWLTTTAAVTPGEEITVVFAIMDIDDSDFDSFALLDNWRWGCEGVERPVTRPVG